jgi:5'-phosphate synthase pdxT subunit
VAARRRPFPPTSLYLDTFRRAAAPDHPAALPMSSPKKTRVGVLAIQGSFAEHCAHVTRAGGEAVEVRKAEQLAGCSGLIIPGGESTTMANIARRWNLFEPLRDFQARGGAVWGTCAGLIFLADRIGKGEKQGGQELLGGLDVTVDRNFFGSQIDSFETKLPCDVPGDESDDKDFRAIFIRAPAILSAGPDVEIMAKYVLPEEKKLETSVEAAHGDVVSSGDHRRQSVARALREDGLRVRAVRRHRREGENGGDENGDRTDQPRRLAGVHGQRRGGAGVQVTSYFFFSRDGCNDGGRFIYRAIRFSQ